MHPSPEFEAFREALAGGVYEGLRYLNGRTPHRFTGVYRFDGDLLRNLHLYDRFDPSVRRGADAPTITTYCAMVGATRASLDIPDARSERRFATLPETSVLSYCGVLIRDGVGAPFGTLCHFDFRPCEQRVSDVPLLEAAAAILYPHVQAAGAL